jgi:ELWxxDGT repeat protein
MTFLTWRRLVLPILLLCPAGPLAAQLAEPVLVQDFAPGSYPGSLEAANIAETGGLLYFAGKDSVHGHEPWVSDGTSAGTRRLADLCPGSCSSYPAGFVRLGEDVVFQASGDYRSGLYRIAGGEILEIVQLDFRVSSWARLGSYVYYFKAGDYRLFRSDGTRQGTTLVRDFSPVDCAPYYICSPPEELREAGGALYFATSGRLYRIGQDGAIADLMGPIGSAKSFTALANGRVVFQGCNGYQVGCQAMSTDGTPAGSLRLEPAGDGYMTAEANDLHAWRGRVYFRNYFNQVLSTDGTPQGTRFEPAFAGEGIDLLAATAERLYYHSLASGTSSASIHVLDGNGLQHHFPIEGNLYELVGSLGDKVFFTYGVAGGVVTPGFLRLAVVDGENLATVHLRDGYAEGAGAVLNGSLYFDFAPSPGHNASGLWRSDGSLAGTALVAAAPDVPLSSSPRPYPLGSGLVAEANDPLASRYHLFKVEPSTLASEPVAEHPLEVLAAGRNRILLADSGFSDARAYGYDGDQLEQLPVPGRPNGGAVAEDDRFFFMTDVVPSQLLWESDGTAAGTRQLFDFGPHGKNCSGGYCGNLALVAPSGPEHVFFFAESDGSPDRPRLSLWDRADQAKRTLLEPAAAYPFPAAVSGGRAYIVQFDFPGETTRLLVSDGTAEGTRPFFEVPAGYYLGSNVVAGHRLYLALYRIESSAVKAALWVSDFTAPGTHRLTAEENVTFDRLVPAGDHLFYFGSDKNGRGLGFSDGTAAGTGWLDLPLLPDVLSDKSLVLDDQRLVFPAIGDDAGNELWISDGSRAGTFRLTDLNPGPAASSPRDFAQVGPKLFFQATNGQTGAELWVVDLPAARPPCPADRLCLHHDRFEVAVVAHAPDGDFQGQRALAAGESGVFTFFSPDNWEMLVKVLDGCVLNDAFWVFASAASDLDYTLTVKDRADGRVRTYRGADRRGAPLLDIAAFGSCALPAPAPVHSPALPPATPAGRCAEDPASFCFGPGGRYRAKVEWQTAGQTGPGMPVPDGSADSGLFTFFSPSNWELMVKLLDGCPINGKRWVYAAGTTDVGWTLTVTDSESPATRVYHNPLGTPSRTLADGAAFDCD